MGRAGQQYVIWEIPDDPESDEVQINVRTIAFLAYISSVVRLVAVTVTAGHPSCDSCSPIALESANAGT